MWNTCNHKWIRVGYGDDLDKYRCEYCNLSNLKNYYFR